MFRFQVLGIKMVTVLDLSGFQKVKTCPESLGFEMVMDLIRSIIQKPDHSQIG